MGYDPLRFLGGAARPLRLPKTNVARLHFLTYHRVDETEAWWLDQLERLRDGCSRRRAGRASARSGS